MYLINFLFIATTVHFSMNYFFERQYKNFLFNLSYSIFYNFGKVEIFTKNIYNKISKNDYIVWTLDKVDDLYKYTKYYDTEIIRDNQVIHRNKLIDLIYNPEPNFIYNGDFIIYSEEIKNDKTNKVLLNFIPCIPISYEKCNYTFLSMFLTFKNNNSNYDIMIFNNNETYFVTNNRINVKLISYLLATRYNIYKNFELLEYNIQIIDNNVNILTISEKDEIILYKEHYEILPYDYKREQENNLKIYKRNMIFKDMKRERTEENNFIQIDDVLDIDNVLDNNEQLDEFNSSESTYNTSDDDYENYKEKSD